MNVRQSTAITIEVGPILNEDGTPYVTDDLDRTDFRVSKNGTSGSLNASATVTHVSGDLQGMFAVTLTTSDVDTLGTLQVVPNSSGLAGGPTNLNVMTQDAWDAMYHASNGRLRANADQVAGSATAATNLKQSALAIATGAVAADGSNTATTFKIDSTLGAKAANYFGNGDGGMVLSFVAGTVNEWQSRRVVSFNTTTDFITVEEAFDGVPTDADAFVLLGRITELS